MTTTDRFVTDGRITDDDIAKLQLRIGYEVPYEFLWNRIATPDAINHFALGYGDDNPLFVDPDYGATTRWGSQIAPPMFFTTMGIDVSKKMPPDVRSASKGALRGVHQFHSGGEWRFYRPIVPGDTLLMSGRLADVEEKESSEFTGGRTVLTHNELDYTTDRGEPTAWEHHWFVHTERDSARKTGKHRDIAEATYTDDDLARIEAAYEHEFVRGPEVLWWDDVLDGEPIPEVVKGPLTVTDVMAMHMGWGWGGFQLGALKVAYRNRKRIPAFYQKDDNGVWDTVQRVHWDGDMARRAGLPTAYDYARMRECWVTHAITNYIGDHGWLYHLRLEYRGFNFLGDTTWVRGTVTGKRIDPVLGPAIDFDVTCENQRGQTTVAGGGTVLLPSRGGGPLRLPDPPAGE